MKRTILIVLCLAAIGTFAIVQAEENTHNPDCYNCETVDGECCCDGTVDGCEENCDVCNECDCDDCDSDEEFHHCRGCH